MNFVNFLDIETIDAEVANFTRKGFDYIASYEGKDTIRRTPRVITPSKRVMTESDIHRHLRKLKFGNSLQLECLQAWEYLQLTKYYYGDGFYRAC